MGVRLVLIFVLVYSSFCQAQTVNWLESRKFSDGHSVIKILVDDEGNSYVLGNYFPAQGSSHPFGSFLTKSNSLGNLEWTISYNNNITGACFNEKDEIVVLSNWEVNFVDRHSGNSHKTYNFSHPNYSWSFKALDVDDDGNLFMIGTVGRDSINLKGITLQNNSFDYLYFYCKLDSTGDVQWAKLSSKGHDSEHSSLSLKVSNDKIFICSATIKDLKFEPESLTLCSYKTNGYLACLDFSGNALWIKDLNYQDIKAFDIDNVGNFYVVGTNYASEGITIDGISSGYYWAEDLFIEKFDSTGKCLWIKNPSSKKIEFGRSISVSDEGDIYVAGDFSDSLAFDNTLLITNGTPTPFLAKLDKNGITRWAIKLDGNGLGSALCFKDNHLFLAGTYNGSMQAGSSSVNGQSSIYLLDIKNNLSSSIKKENRKPYIRIYPNPTDNSFHIDSEIDIVSLKIFGIKGEQIKSNKLSSKSLDYDLGDIPSGIYQIDISYKGGNQVLKLIKK